MSNVLKAISSIILPAACMPTCLSTCLFLSVSLYRFFALRLVLLDYLVAQLVRVPDHMGDTFICLNT